MYNYDDNIELDNVNANLNITHHSENKSCKDNKNSCYHVFAVLFFPFVYVISLLILYIKKNNKKKNIVGNFDHFFKEKVENDNISRTCIICIDNISYNDLIFTKCDHYYHEFCIKKWLTLNQVCPICKRQYEVNV